MTYDNLSTSEQIFSVVPNLGEVLVDNGLGILLGLSARMAL